MFDNQQYTATKFFSSWSDNSDYFSMLKLMASLSRLFSENEIPYLDYRLAENLFCKYFQAQNDARSCTAYDARIGSLGIGIKTFILEKDQSLEKIAEFNKLKSELDGCSGLDLAKKLGEFRNNRMLYANSAFNVNCSQYHIVGRKKALLRIFNSPYELVDVDNIRLTKDDTTSISFVDGKNEYLFNRSKTVLMKRFVLPSQYKDVPVDIIDDPLTFLDNLFLKGNELVSPQRKVLEKGKDYVILPLYSTRTGEVPEKSGLNQWNAGGRARDENELYIPVPKAIHHNYPDFFPSRDCPFHLCLPDGKVLSAKICQDGGKALMSNPNKDLGEWFLRKVMKKVPGEIVTKRDLDIFGIDSVFVEKTHRYNSEGQEIFRISFADSYESYNNFVGE